MGKKLRKKSPEDKRHRDLEKREKASRKENAVYEKFIQKAKRSYERILIFNCFFFAALLAAIIGICVKTNSPQILILAIILMIFLFSLHLAARIEDDGTSTPYDYRGIAWIMKMFSVAAVVITAGLSSLAYFLK